MGSSPANPNNRRLLTSVWLNDGQEGEIAHEKADEFLQLMGLPDPEHHEYYTGPRGNVDRIYLPEGLVASFVYRRASPFASLFNRSIKAPVFEARKIVDERILQPLLQVDFTDACCLELNVGTRSSSDPKIAKVLAKELKASGIKLDPQPEFIGMVGEHSFVSNRRAIVPLRADVINNENASAGWQHGCYGSLSDLAAEAYATKSHEKFRQLREICAEIVRLPVSDPNHIVHRPWKDTDIESPRRKQIAEAAKHYENRLAAA